MAINVNVHFIGDRDPTPLDKSRVQEWVAASIDPADPGPGVGVIETTPGIRYFIVITPVAPSAVVAIALTCAEVEQMLADPVH
jgi:hypothetical protein